MQMMQVTVPAGVAVGQPFVVQTPSGQQETVVAQVPEGQMMQVQVPTGMAQPMAVATPVPMAQPMAMQHGGPVVVGAPPTQYAAQQAPSAVVEGYPAEMVTLPVAAVVGMELPTDPAMFITGALGNAVDAVPMIDAQTAGILNSVNKFKVKQRLAIWEAISQGCCEQQNVYDIFDADTGQPLFTTIEESEDCVRCCCAPNHSFFVKFKPAGVGVSRTTASGHGRLLPIHAPPPPHCAPDQRSPPRSLAGSPFPPHPRFRSRPCRVAPRRSRRTPRS